MTIIHRPGKALLMTIAILAAGQGECCSFFSFTFAPADGAVHFDVAVPEAHADVLDALAGRAAAGIGS
jgi:hypothetical protein